MAPQPRSIRPFARFALAVAIVGLAPLLMSRPSSPPPPVTPPNNNRLRPAPLAPTPSLPSYLGPPMPRILRPPTTPPGVGSLGMILAVRTCSNFEPVLRTSLLPGLLALWDTATFGALLLVTDEIPEDAVFAARLVAEAPHLILPVPAEEPPEHVHGGYNRQQYDTLLLDTYLPAGTPPDTVIGIVDSDSLLVTFPTEGAYFDDRGRPRALLRLEVPFGELWRKSAAASAWIIGKPQPGRGMCTFPVLVRAQHLASLRAHVEGLHGKPFALVFGEMVSMHGLYSQFNVLATYLWHFHREFYDWGYWVPMEGLAAAETVRFWTPTSFEPDGVTGLTWTGGHWNFSAWKTALSGVPGHMTDFPFIDSANGATRIQTMQHYRHERTEGIPLPEHLSYDLCYALYTVKGDARVDDLCGDGKWMDAAFEHTRWGAPYLSAIYPVEGLSRSLFDWEGSAWIAGQLDGSPRRAQERQAAAVAAGVAEGRVDVERAVEVLHWYRGLGVRGVREPIRPDEPGFVNGVDYDELRMQRRNEKEAREEQERVEREEQERVERKAVPEAMEGGK